MSDNRDFPFTFPQGGGQSIDFNSQVVIGLGPDTGVKVSKKTFSTAFVVVSVVFSLGFLAFVIGVSVWIWYSNRGVLPPPIETTSDSNFDGRDLNQTQCVSSGNTWNNGCECKSGYHGTKCTTQVHDPRYFALGIPYNADYNVLHNSSQTKIDCGRMCDSMSGCNGFIWDQGECALIQGVNVRHNGTVNHNVHTDSKLYLRSRENIDFENRIFLGKYTVSLPSRFWLVDATDTYKQIQIQQVSYLDFVPAYFKTHTRRTGIYSTFEFSESELTQVMQQTSRVVIHDTDLPLELPESWEGKRLWVYYY